MCRYRALLIDDEFLLREKMAQKIPWEALGFELVAACENGRQAIEILEQQKIDVVLTDIRMPYVNGIELAKYIHEKNDGIQNTKVVIISGHAEFEYAKQAMRYEVHSYLLKPVTLEELTAVLGQIRKKLDVEQMNQKIHGKYQENYFIFRAKELMKIVEHSLSKEEIYHILDENGKDFHRRCGCCCAVVMYSDLLFLEEQSEKIERDISALSDRMLLFRMPDGGFGFVFGGDNISHVKETVKEVKNSVNRYMQKEHGTEVMFLIGGIRYDYEHLHMSFQQALELREFHYLQRKDGLYFWEEYCEKKNYLSPAGYEEQQKEKLLMAVQSNLVAEIVADVNQVVYDAKKNWFRKVKTIFIYRSMLMQTMNFLQRVNVEGSQLLKEMQEAVEQLYQSEKIQNMAKTTLKFLLVAAETRNKERENYGERQAALAVEYIDRHFDDCVLQSSGVASMPGAAIPFALALSLQFRRVCSEMPSSLAILKIDSLFGGNMRLSNDSLSSGL